MRARGVSHWQHGLRLQFCLVHKRQTRNVFESSSCVLKLLGTSEQHGPTSQGALAKTKPEKTPRPSPVVWSDTSHKRSSDATGARCGRRRPRYEGARRRARSPRATGTCSQSSTSQSCTRGHARRSARSRERVPAPCAGQERGGRLARALGRPEKGRRRSAPKERLHQVPPQHLILCRRLCGP